MIRLLRPKQWTKGAVVLAAPIFSNRFLEGSDLLKIFLALVSISAMSSCAYVFNDFIDQDRDRAHPVKKFRPIASGEISKNQAIVTGILLAIIAFSAISSVGRSATLLIILYAVLQILYNLWLKDIPVTDVFIVSIGYVIRAMLGAAAVVVPISGWLLFCTGALALLVGFGKRRAEFVLNQGSHAITREVLTGYTREVLDIFLVLSAAGAAMSYGIYSLISDTAHKHPALILTSIWVLYAIYRYVYLVVAKNEGGEPESLFLKDPHLIASIILFLIFAIAALKGFQIHLVEVPRI